MTLRRVAADELVWRTELPMFRSLWRPRGRRRTLARAGLLEYADLFHFVSVKIQAANVRIAAVMTQLSSRAK